MSKLSPNQIRDKFIEFYINRAGYKHAAIPSAALVPEGDSTTLFTSSGMQPLVHYLMGQPHPKGTRLVNAQKCFRAVDIEEVGDTSHTTFFEMLGNWSLGDYFKEQQLSWYFELLTQEFGFDPHKLYVTVYRGNQEYGIPRDDESVAIWQRLFKSVGIEAKAIDFSEKEGMQGGRIFYYSDDDNWWSRSGVPGQMPIGEIGGPSSEVFYDFGEDHSKKFEATGDVLHVNSDCYRFLEIGNSVFMTYEKTEHGFEPLKNKNIDFGGGLERTIAALNDDPDVFKTDLFKTMITEIERISGQEYQTNKMAFRVIADHVKAAVMLAADGVIPGPKQQGYFSRRLMRRAVRYGKMLGIENQFIGELISVVVELYQDVYPEVARSQKKIKVALDGEEQKFRRTLEKGLREFEKNVGSSDQRKQELTAELAFQLFETYGFPLELSIEEAATRKIAIEPDIESRFEALKTKHADKSRTASVGMFKGGLADHSQTTVRYHTATHLLHAALRQILGDSVQQKGSNINEKRLRFDFSFDRALTDQEKQQVEDQVNAWIDADLPVTQKMMAKQEALQSGAIAFFVEKYPDEVSVYTIGVDPDGQPHSVENGWISKEFCGGPHVTHTAEIGHLKLTKEKSASAGVRRIYMIA